MKLDAEKSGLSYFDFVPLALILNVVCKRNLIMKPIISRLFEEGDYYLKEAKQMFYLRKEEQYLGPVYSCMAIKRYLDAYEKHLFRKDVQTENYHVLLQLIIQHDPAFRKFSEKIFEVKCFAQESENQKEGFFLFAEEMNDVIHIVLEIRSYVAKKVAYKSDFLSEYFSSFMMST